MPLLAQHGHAKGNKIDIGIRQGLIDGVILSPRDERADQICDVVQRWLDQSTEGRLQIVMDSQLYASVIGSTRLGKLEDYPFYPGQLGRRSFASISRLQDIVHSAIDYQCGLPLTSILSPAVPIDAVNSVWSGVYLTLLDESCTYYSSKGDSRPLYGSLLIEEGALVGARADLDALLDDLTSYEVDGYYIVIVRNAVAYPSIMSEDCMNSAMYLAYVLAEVNGYDVIWGFSDLDGIPLVASSVGTIATGWYANLRQFSYARWLPSGGGRQPRPRYTSVQLISSLIKDIELQSIYDLGQILSVIRNDQYDSAFSSADPAVVSWRLEAGCLQHWRAVGRLAQDVSTGAGVSRDLDVLEDAIADAISYALLLDTHGAAFSHPFPWSRLESWSAALGRFRSEVGI